MSDHGSGPRAFADPVVDITDMYAFPSPERTGSLVLVLNVFPFAQASTRFSDTVDYRFRVRPVRINARESGAAFAVQEDEFVFSCRFSAPTEPESHNPPVQEGTCTASTGAVVALRVNDEQGGRAPGMRVFAGLRMDPWFFDSARMMQTIKTRQLAFVEVAKFATFRQNVLSIVVDLDVATIFGVGHAPLLAVVGETAVVSPRTVRLERVGRPEVKNLILFSNDFDAVNRDVDLRDLYNEEDAFNLGRTYLGAYRARMNANLAFFDSLDGNTDWSLDERGAHPLTELLLADYLVVDVSRPYAEDSYFEIERKWLRGEVHETCGGRSLNDDIVDTLLTLLINAGNGARIRDGVDQATVPAAQHFPYLAAPEAAPPPLPTLVDLER
jgi:hypothetical protein